jgi:hypothetical protein
MLIMLLLYLGVDKNIIQEDNDEFFQVISEHSIH